METTKIAVFRGKQIRRYWDDNRHSWFFSVVDIITALTDSENPAVYWRVLKKRLKDEGADQTVTKCNAFKMPAADGKMRLTDVADTETMFRLIQSIPSPKAEPFKRWLARVLLFIIFYFQFIICFTKNRYLNPRRHIFC
jgi:prophage antirepressor-like protein